MNTRNQEAIVEIFDQYDPQKTGEIDRSVLKKIIFDLNGRELDDTELSQVFDLMDISKTGKIKREEFINIMEQFFKFC